MADINDVIKHDKEVSDWVRQLNEEAPIEKTLAIGFVAVVCAIQALGVRLDYVMANWLRR